MDWLISPEMRDRHPTDGIVTGNDDKPWNWVRSDDITRLIEEVKTISLQGLSNVLCDYSSLLMHNKWRFT